MLFSIDEAATTVVHGCSNRRKQYCVGNSSVVKRYIIRPKPGPVAKNAMCKCQILLLIYPENNIDETSLFAIVIIVAQLCNMKY